MEIEVIIQDGEDAEEAKQLGVDRLEFVSAMKEGGLTPSYGAMKQVLKNKTIPVYTMVRPHGHHFYYDEGDKEMIFTDIEKIISLGGSRIVTGALNQEQKVDENFLQEIINRWPQLTITFHRAFDEVTDQIEAYHTLVKYKENVKYILTSGGEEDCIKGLESLKKLITLAKEVEGPEIMPGSGLNPDNIAEIHEKIQAKHYHFGSAVRLEGSFANTYDKRQIKAIQRVLQS